MKKILLTITMIGCFVVSAFANQPIRTTEFSEEQVLEQEVSEVEFSETNDIVEILVEANDIVDQVCDYFNGSWLDVGLTLYCTVNPASGVCIAYKITQIGCAVNKTVKLLIEGDINNATKTALKTGAKIWAMSKVGNTIKLSPSNMCPAN